MRRRCVKRGHKWQRPWHTPGGYYECARWRCDATGPIRGQQ